MFNDIYGRYMDNLMMFFHDIYGRYMDNYMDIPSGVIKHGAGWKMDHRNP